jgi:hypothetical protein
MRSYCLLLELGPAPTAAEPTVGRNEWSNRYAHVRKGRARADGTPPKDPALGVVSVGLAQLHAPAGSS